MSYEPDLERVNQVWPDGARLESVDDLFSVTVAVGAPPRKVATHLFGERITIIPYEQPDTDAPIGSNAAVETPHGADEIARYFPPGDVGFAIKHRRTQHRTLAAGRLAGPQLGRASGLSDEFKQHIKLQDVHIAAVLGVGEPIPTGETYSPVVVVSNPESYEKELFYKFDYPMVFVRPRFPDWVGERRDAFMGNLRTMLVCFNIVTQAPDDYDNQPLAARSLATVRELVTMMIRAIASDPAGAEFFGRQGNAVYCGELIHLAATAALHWPLNRSTCEQLVDPPTWSAFEAAIGAHNAGAPGALARTRSNSADLLAIQLPLAHEDLKPVVEYAPAHLRTSLAGALAFPPMTLFGMVEHFVKLHWPRQQLGDHGALVQKHVVDQLGFAFKAWTRGSLSKLTDRQVVEVDRHIKTVVSTVGADYSSYDEFEQSLARVRQAAEDFMASNGLEHLATPPSMFHLIAQGRYGDRGLLGIDYVGHGLHRSLVRTSPE